MNFWHSLGLLALVIVWLLFCGARWKRWHERDVHRMTRWNREL